jgi:hypothetical protein
MGLLKVIEFAEKYGITRTNVYTYEKRRKVIIVDGYVDEDNPINRLFVETRKKSRIVHKTKKEVKTVREVKEIKPKEYVTKIPETKQEIQDESITRNKITALTSYKERTDSILDTNDLKDELLRVDLRIKQLRADVQERKLIPFDLAKQGIIEVVTRFKSSFIQQIEQLMRDSLNEMQAPNEIITRSCSRIIDISNEVSKRAHQEAEITMSNIADESSRL